MLPHQTKGLNPTRFLFLLLNSLCSSASAPRTPCTYITLIGTSGLCCSSSPSLKNPTPPFQKRLRSFISSEWLFRPLFHKHDALNPGRQMTPGCILPLLPRHPCSRHPSPVSSQQSSHCPLIQLHTLPNQASPLEWRGHVSQNSLPPQS